MSTLTTKRDQGVATVEDVQAALAELHRKTGGRGKWWQAAKRATKLMCAISSATGARKVALERQLDALEKKYAG